MKIQCTAHSSTKESNYLHDCFFFINYEPAAIDENSTPPTQTLMLLRAPLPPHKNRNLFLVLIWFDHRNFNLCVFRSNHFLLLLSHTNRTGTGVEVEIRENWKRLGGGSSIFNRRRISENCAHGNQTERMSVCLRKIYHSPWARTPTAFRLDDQCTREGHCLNF